MDLIFGDPSWLPHPVKGIGWLIVRLDFVLRNLFKNKKIAGIFLVFFVVGPVWIISFIIVRWVSGINYYAGLIISGILIYTSLSIKDLKIHSMRVVKALNNNNEDDARKNLSLIVGRDTVNLDRQGVIRATIETVAENSVDGIISPFFYAFIGGAPLALAYKAINTLDSMVGYKNEKYKEFGWASAKIDDMANFIPARLSFFILPLSGLLAGKGWLRSLKIALRDGKNNPSPNSGIPEAAVSGALGVRLGGLNFYNSVPVLKPFIGDELYSLESKHIGESLRIIYCCAFLSVIIGVVTFLLIVKKGG